MNPAALHPPARRLFSEAADRPDDLGFLDPDRTPRLVPAAALFDRSPTWVLGRPWLGKSTVARELNGWLRNTPTAFGGVCGRVALTQFGEPHAAHEVPPWWADWCRADPAPAAWLIDGVDEGLDRTRPLFDRILAALGDASRDHRRQLRLVLFSRPYAELGDFRDQLTERFEGPNGWRQPPQFWLTRLDRGHAEEVVGPARFPAVCDLIRRNDLRPIAGYPVVLNYLARYRETASLGLADVWRGILDALLGEPRSNPAARFQSSTGDRLRAAARMAAVLTLTGRDAVRGYVPHGVDAVAIGGLFDPPDTALQATAEEATRTAAFVTLPEQGAYRFAQRNVQDWLTAFALDRLPVGQLRSALTGADGRTAWRLREPARLLHRITTRPDVRAEVDRLGGGVTLPSDAADPTLAEAVRCLDQLEAQARAAPWGLRLDDDVHNLARLGVDGFGPVLAARFGDPDRPPQVLSLLLDVAHETEVLEALTPAAALAIDGSRPEGLRSEAAWVVSRHGGNADVLGMEEQLQDGGHGDEADRRVYGEVLQEVHRRQLMPAWQLVLRLPAQRHDLLDARTTLAHALPRELTADDARQLLPHLRTLWDRHPDSANRLPELIDAIITAVVGRMPPYTADLALLAEFALTGRLKTELAPAG